MSDPMQYSRERIAAFVLERRDRIVRLATEALTAAERAAYGSDDVFATVWRRVDNLAAAGMIRASSEAELDALVTRIARNMINTRLRWLNMARRHHDDVFWSRFADRLEGTASDAAANELVDALLASLQREQDRFIVMARLMGWNHQVIADQLNVSVEAARQRWSKLRQRLLDGLGDGP